MMDLYFMIRQALLCLRECKLAFFIIASSQKKTPVLMLRMNRFMSITAFILNLSNPSYQFNDAKVLLDSKDGKGGMDRLSAKASV